MSIPTVLIVSYRRSDVLDRCLRSLRTHVPDWPVHVWDNASPGSPAIRELAQCWPDFEWTFCAENIGFAAAVNRLAGSNEGDFLLLNPDAVVLGRLTPLVESMAADPRCAAVGPLGASGGDAIWDNGRRLPSVSAMFIEYAGYAGRLRRWRVSGRYPSIPETVGWLSGFCVLVRRKAWEQVGGFDERFWLYCEEVDWATRAAEAGWRLRMLPIRLVEHAALGTVADSKEAVAASQALLLQSQVKYVRKHRGPLAAWGYERGCQVLEAVQRSKRRSRCSFPSLGEASS